MILVLIVISLVHLQCSFVSSCLAQVNLDQDASKPTQASHVPTVFSQLNSSTDELDSGAYVNPLSMEYGKYTVQNISR